MKFIKKYFSLYFFSVIILSCVITFFLMREPSLKHSIWVKITNVLFPLLIFVPIIYNLCSMFTLKLNKIFFIDEKNGWAVGSKGIILNTRNGGLSWTEQISGTKKDLTGVEFLDSNNGWIVGEEELILHTDNGGNNWKSNKESSEPSFINNIINYIIPRNFKGPDLIDVHFIDGDNGWAAGGIAGKYIKILHTSDGGKTWEAQENSLMVEKIKELDTVYCIKFTDRENGWVAGIEGIILNTTDGGNKWNYHKDITSKTISGMDFKGNHGWFVGSDGVILHTPDGGKTWEKQESGTEDFLYDVFFTDSLNGWIIGEDGHIFHTENGGKKWEIFDTGINKALISIYFIDNKKGWASGDKKSIFHTTDGGKTWIEQL